VFIRPSTSHLCIDLTPPETDNLVLAPVSDGPQPYGISLFTPPSESEMVTSMSLRDYHSICYRYLGRPYYWLVSPNVSVKLGSIHYWSRPEYESSLEVTSADCRIYDYGWSTMDPIVEGHMHP
jgi:hypothetical protein